MHTPLVGISSMATRRLLVDLCDAGRDALEIDARFESVGGVDAARRVRGGAEVFDLVVLAGDAIDALAAAGHVRSASRRALADSPVAVAVEAAAARPDITSESGLRQAVQAAATIGYSTGPSGTALLALFERWGWSDSLRERLVQAPPGVPVASLVADGRAELGFQQLSELMGMDGITVLGVMPPGLEIVTTFVGAVGVGSPHADAAQRLLDFMASAATAPLKQRHGMQEAAR